MSTSISAELNGFHIEYHSEGCSAPIFLICRTTLKHENMLSRYICIGSAIFDIHFTWLLKWTFKCHIIWYDRCNKTASEIRSYILFYIQYSKSQNKQKYFYLMHKLWLLIEWNYIQTLNQHLIKKNSKHNNEAIWTH